MALGVGAIAASSAFGLVEPQIIGRAVDVVLETAEARAIVRYALALLAVTAAHGVFSFSLRMLLVTLSRDIENDLRNRFFSHLERMPASFFQTRPTGDLMARGTNDLGAVRMICGPAIMYAGNTLFTSIGALFFMARIHLPLTLAALATMPLVAVATRVVGQRIHALFDSVQEQFAALSTRVQENLAGARVVRAYVQERAEEAAFAELNREYVRRNRGLIRWTAAFHPLLQVLVGLGFATVLWYGGSLVARGTLSVGQFVSFNFFLTKLVWPMIAIGWVMNLVQRGSASLNRIFEVLDAEPEIRDEPPLAHLAEPRGAVSVRGLTFTHPGAASPALVDVSLELPPGRVLAIVGRTGSGKSTLLATLPRLVEPPPGAVFVDGVDVRRLALADLRSLIGMVPQEPFLFSDTIARNIALGRDGAAAEEVLEAARSAGLEDDLAALPNGIDTVVGERGITLSGGQKQRVALARALLREPRILILDDSLSAVDTRTEEAILANLRRLFVARTVLLVSHRISTVRTADEIVVLEAGRIAERGSHDELAARGGPYADLDRRQRLEEELEAV